ncbi:MAG: DUF2935 domain-containing protein, partial [bacterium]
ISLSPTFLKHTVDELDEYLLILPHLLSGTIPPPLPAVHYHLVWLLDAMGHSDIIACSVDMIEKGIQEKSEVFSKHFQELYLKAVEVAGYMRTNLQQFPFLTRFNSQVDLEMRIFIKFLNELEELTLPNELLGILSPLILDHMAREECYYLTKLSQVSDIKPPDCDPTKARRE